MHMLVCLNRSPFVFLHSFFHLLLRLDLNWLSEIYQFFLLLWFIFKNNLSFFFIFWWDIFLLTFPWVWTQGLTLGEKALYHLSHTQPSFALLNFSDRVLCFSHTGLWQRSSYIWSPT
jgi:hypothetical protein